MKNLVRYLSFAIIIHIVFCINIVAQEKQPFMSFSIHLGAALPVGEIGGIYGAESIDPGFCALIDCIKDLGHSSSLVTSINLAVNNLNTDVVRKKNPTFAADGNYTTTWIMTGFRIEGDATKEIKMYGLTQVGMIISGYPETKYSNGYETVTNTPDRGIGLAFGLGCGVRTNRLNIGLRYYTGDPEMTMTTKYGTSGAASSKLKLPTSILQLMVGIDF